VTTTADAVLNFFTASKFLNDAGFGDASKQLTFVNNRLEFGAVEMNSYLSSVASDFIRQKLMEQNISFTLETVMSHPGKVDLLAQAQAAGYRTHLYFVATDDPAINISRVRSRVELGGHDVPKDRIEARYHRSLELLMGPSGTRTALTFSTTPVTTPTANTPGWRKSPRANSWN
jgi:hypothetical protein